MRSLGLFIAALLVAGALIGDANKASAQVVYYASRPVLYRSYAPYYSYRTPAYAYEGGWYSGSYMNNYGNYGSYHVMTPVWTGGSNYGGYRYGW